VDVRPNYPSSGPSTDTEESVKISTPDIILLVDSPVGAEILTDLIFQNIGGIEIINIARSDVINGQNVTYQPIKNITSLFYQYNPQNILALQGTDKDYFKNFAINLNDRLPEFPYLYTDENGDLIIEVINMLPSESVEVQTVYKVEVLDDTIYTEENI
jgi:hypothetical protein